MAVTSNCAKFLFYAKTLGISFENTLTLGRMVLYASKEDILFLTEKYNNFTWETDKANFKDKYAEPLFEILGGKLIESLDFSNYEGATILHDLNKPIPTGYYSKYDVVFDGGTIEHVFNFPECIKNCMKLLKNGGHFIGITPCNNLMGHGFYQFSPELYYRVFSEENGFVVKKMFIVSFDLDGNAGNWYEVEDPKKVNERVILVNNRVTHLLVIAMKTAEKDVFSVTPYQSDYNMTWASNDTSGQKTNYTKKNRVLDLMRRILPYRIKVILNNTYDLFFKEKIRTPDMGTINPKHFKEFNG